MHWLRRWNGRKFTTGVALAAILMHVVALSLHFASAAALAANPPAASRLSMMICGPARISGERIFNSTGADEPGGSGNSAAGYVCPYCTGAASAPPVLPPAYFDTPSRYALPTAAAYEPGAAADPTPAKFLSEKRSRAPPLPA